jgi:8-oxo-dGTP pyrophosphatase MutT (NUDIX family)
MLKYASAVIMTADLAPKGASRRELRRFAHRHHFDYEVRPGFLYVRSRAISSRCNDNFDEFPAEELAKAYATFIGKPVFVNHVNHDHRRARGVIIDAALHKDSNRDGTKDWWVEVLQEVDAVRFPRLAKEILAGNIARTSMGCDVAFSVCSACGNRATTPAEYCQHIPGSKGMMLYRRTASGQKVGEIIRETCYGLKFFENSLLVEPPADPTAHFLGVDTRGLQSTAMRKGAPFADYKDFEQCTEENSDKDDPSDYCGEIKHKTEDSKKESAYTNPYEHDDKTAGKDPRFEGVGLKQDDNGWYVTTHRARSDSYESPEKIPQSVVDKIESTGKRVTRIDLKALAARKKASSPDGWTEGESLGWDAIGERHPDIYGDPEVHEGAEGDGDGIGWAASHLAHATPKDPDADEHGSWDLTFHSEHVDPYNIDHARHGGASDGRVRYAAQGYKENPDQVPPLVLVHRHGVYQVADGHHRAEGAKLANQKTVRAYVAYSPYPNEPSSDGERAPYHGAKEHPGKQPQWEKDFQAKHARKTAAWSGNTYNPAEFPPDAPHNAVAYQPGNGDYKVSCERGCTDAKGFAGHWGQHGAAGLLIRHQDQNGTQRFLMQQRHFHMQHGGTWSIPGGGTTAEEVGNPKRTAFREAKEEMGRNIPELRVSHTHHDDHGGWGYHTVVADTHQPFVPTHTSNEHLGSGWFTANEVDKLNLHPGFKESWDKVKDTLSQHPWQSPYGKQAKLAYGEQKAPMDVDTLREDACPVCGDRDTFDGDTCEVCGYVAPPKIFQDPDLEKARQMDLRKDVAEFNDPANPNQIGPDGQPVQDPMDPNALDENGNPINPDAADQEMQPGMLPGEVPAEVQPGGDPMDPGALGEEGQIPEETGAPVDPSMLGPDGQPLPQQQMTLPDGTPIGPQTLPGDATTNMGQPFTPGPNMPEGPGEPEGPEGPATPEDLDEDGQPVDPDAGQGVPGTPGDGVPDLMCPACGFTTEATQPTSVDMDTQELPNVGMAQMDGAQAGDVCPNCGSAQLLSPAEVQGQSSVPMPV